MYKIGGTWKELKEVFGEFEHKEHLSKRDFSAEYELIINSGSFSSDAYVVENYTPKNPPNMDGKLSISTTLYSINLRENTSKDIRDLLKDVLQYQLDYYNKNGFPNRPSSDPSEAVENAVRH